MKTNILHLKKFLPIYSYGAIIVLVGILLHYSGSWTFETLKYTTSLSLIFAALMVIVTLLSRKNKQVVFFYHEMHAFTMLIYGFFVLLFCNKLETLILLNYFLFFFYAFSEIIFCLWIFNLGKKVLYKIVVIRLITGLLVGVGIVVIMSYPEHHFNVTIENFGPLYILVGINILLYVPVIKSIKLKKKLNN